MSEKLIEIKANQKVKELLSKHNLTDAKVNTQQVLYLLEGLSNKEEFARRYKKWNLVYEKLKALENE
jgi:hypothetical protein